MLITSSATQSLFDAIRQNTLQGATGLALWQAIRSEVFHFLCAEAARRLNRDGFGCRGLDAGEIASD